MHYELFVFFRSKDLSYKCCFKAISIQRFAQFLMVLQDLQADSAPLGGTLWACISAIFQWLKRSIHTQCIPVLNGFKHPHTLYIVRPNSHSLFVCFRTSGASSSKASMRLGGSSHQNSSSGRLFWHPTKIFKHKIIMHNRVELYSIVPNNLEQGIMSYLLSK